MTGVKLIGLALVAAMMAPPVRPVVQTSRVPVIVELFTSEGCSSCPPADQLLGELIKTQPVPGALVIGLSEHVDYWDRLGWKDAFSSAAATARQSRFAAAHHDDDIYTPQMIVDGADVFIGHDRAAAIAAIGRAGRAPKPSVRLDWTTAPARTLDVTIDPSAGSSGATVWLVVTEDALASVVTRGENEGRRLAHDGVVRRIASIGRVARDGSFHAITPVPVDAAWRIGALHAVVFAELQQAGRIVAAGAVAVRP